ncbi:centrosomal protein of 120 kDa-like [Bacillus rossius redtenbacheri]|uniref:centrosomal protein of 120 kDa-like n=1 Tax=Bacillus rossius redtenbacheri TaxID=93214 RepID=UPI002FDE8DA6
MDDLIGRDVEIDLAIKEGCGFSPSQHQLVVEASLDGHILTTRLVPCCSEPQFHEVLTWIIDKKRLRRLRTSTASIRVNCYSLIGPHEREIIGFCLLHLKNSKIQTDSHPQVAHTWHRLAGGQPPHPQLLLSYCFRSVVPQLMQTVQSAPTLPGAEMGCGDHAPLVPDLHSEQGIVPIGSACFGTDTFLLTVSVDEISNLHLLVPENAGHPREEPTFYFCYKVFGHTIKTKSFTVDSATSDFVSDLNKLKICCSLSGLKLYLEKESIPFALMSGDEEVGSASVELKTFVPTEDTDEFCSKYTGGGDRVVRNVHCLLTSPKTQRVPVGEGNSKPGVKISLALQAEQRQTLPVVALEVDGNVVLSSLEHRSAGQIAEEGDELSADPDSASSLSWLSGGERDAGDQGRAAGELPRSPGSPRGHSAVEPLAGRAAPHRYHLHIKLESVLFHKPVSDTKVFFKFVRPGAESPGARRAEVPLRGGSCRLAVLAAPGDIGRALVASQPRLFLCSRTPGGQTLVLASAGLEGASLLCADQRGCCFSKVLRNISTRDQVATVKISMVLEDTGIHLAGDTAESGLPRTAVNATLLKTVEELQEWKEKQQAIFTAEMREKQSAQLALLAKEWSAKRAGLEAAMRGELRKCSRMKEDLERSRADLRLGLEKNSEREKQVVLLKENLESEWARKLRDLEDLSARLEPEFDKESQWRRERTQLEQRVADLQQELEVWKERARLREAEHEETRKNKVMEESASHLVQELNTIEEKLDAALKLKSFYKQQWVHAVKEVLRLKTENQSSAQISVRREERDLLVDLGALRALHEAEAGKREDQDALTTIKDRELGRGGQEQSDAVSRASRGVPALSSTDKGPVASMSSRDAEALRELTAERDALLRTGSYGPDDPIIANMNAQIQVLLAKRKM